MTADAQLPLLSPERPVPTWRVTFPGDDPRTYQAASFRVDAGALVLLLPAGGVAAFAPGQWLTVESEARDRN